MNIPVNKDNYMREWLKLIAIFKNIKRNSLGANITNNEDQILNLSGRSIEIFEAIARYKQVGREERQSIANLLSISEASLGNYIKLLKDIGLIKKVKEKNKPYYYTCTFPTPSSLEQLLLRQEIITFKLDDSK